jgi:homoserine kinase
MKYITVRVPATSANLGPGFDSLGLALDIWNETIFSLEGEDCTVVVTGEGSGTLPKDQTNLIAQAAYSLYDSLQQKPDPGLLVRCFNQIPLTSGMGSSAAALVTGLLGANALMGNPLNQQEILSILTEMEGHGDNVSPAILGGLVAVSGAGENVAYRRVWDGSIGGDILQAAIVLPEINLPTSQARAILPAVIPHADAVFNLQKAILVVHAFETGDLELLGEVMVDRLHQPYRLAMIPGGEAVIEQARKAGAAAAAISGAGPSIIAFGLEDMNPIADAMQAAFKQAGIQSRRFITTVCSTGAQVIFSEG